MVVVRLYGWETSLFSFRIGQGPVHSCLVCPDPKVEATQLNVLRPYRATPQSHPQEPPPKPTPVGEEAVISQRGPPSPVWTIDVVYHGQVMGM